MSDSHGEHKPSVLSDALAIGGFIILTIIVIWGLVHLVSLSGSWISSLFPKHTATIEVTAPADAFSADPIQVSWKYTPTEKGSYALLYQCKDGLEFQTYNSNGSSYSTIPCGAAFSINTATSSITLIPTYTGTSTVAAPITILFIPSAVGAQITGEATVNVHSGSLVMQAAAKPPKTKTAATATPSKTKVTYRATGPADLSVRIVAVGIINPQTGAFITAAPTSPDQTVAVEFDIANVGNSSTGTYYFQAQLPTQSAYTYQSPAQASLAPGDHVLNTLRFTQVASGGGTFTVIVTPQGAADYTTNNNYAQQFVAMPNYYAQY